MKRPKAKTIFICFGLFLVFLLLRFPFSNLKGYVFSQIHQNTGISVVFAEDMYLSLLGWPGIGLKNVEIIIPEQVMGMEMDMSAKKVVARVGIGSILPPSLSYSVAIDGLKKGGDVYVKLSRLKMAKNGALTSANVYFDADKLDLSQVPLGGQSLTGKLSGEVNLSMEMTDLSKTQGNLTLNIDKFSTPGASPQGFVIPPIKMGDLKSKVQVKGGTVELNNFQFGGAGSDLQGALGGEVRLGPNFFQSALNITMRVKVAESFAKNQDAATLITILDNFDKRAPGKEYNLRWNKSIAQISQNFLDHPPEPLP